MGATEFLGGMRILHRYPFLPALTVTAMKGAVLCSHADMWLPLISPSHIFCLACEAHEGCGLQSAVQDLLLEMEPLLLGLKSAGKS